MFSKGSEQQMRFWRHDSESWNQSWDLNCIVVWSTITLVSACPNFVNSLLPFNLSSRSRTSATKKDAPFFCPHQIGTCKQNFSTLGPPEKASKALENHFPWPFCSSGYLLFFPSWFEFRRGQVVQKWHWRCMWRILASIIRAFSICWLLTFPKWIQFSQKKRKRKTIKTRVTVYVFWVIFHSYSMEIKGSKNSFSLFE